MRGGEIVSSDCNGPVTGSRDSCCATAGALPPSRSIEQLPDRCSPHDARFGFLSGQLPLGILVQQHGFADGIIVASGTLTRTVTSNMAAARTGEDVSTVETPRNNV
jgi:hypothetical protein